MTAPKFAPYKPAPYEMPDASALQAVAQGRASEAQQQRALRWIIEVACGTYDLTYFPESDRDTCFAEGKRFVGLQVVKMLKLNPSVFSDNHDARG